jgi:hypothetical protein
LPRLPAASTIGSANHTMEDSMSIAEDRAGAALALACELMTFIAMTGNKEAALRMVAHAQDSPIPGGLSAGALKLLADFGVALELGTPDQTTH